MGPMLDIPKLHSAAGLADGGVPGRLVRRQVAASCTAYVGCTAAAGGRYVGSVRRQGSGLVGDRLAEHYAHHRARMTRRTPWCLLPVFPLPERVLLGPVRITEGWTAQLRNPADGSAHPRVQYGRRRICHRSLGSDLGVHRSRAAVPAAGRAQESVSAKG